MISFSSAFLMLFARRSTAKGPHPEWGFVVGALIGIIILLLDHWLK